ncbi:MAG: hypothetical protein H0T79_08645, partial [Deltaproteobacteria bacterium]|nr:hypothetical protein [Deltaproteobacteria bacterium]
MTLAVDGKPRTASTDAAGRATFAGIAVGAHVAASVANAGALGTSTTFTIPAAGGTRVMLSTQPWAAPDPGLVLPRAFSGQPRIDPSVPAGTLTVRLSYDDLTSVAPAGVTVALVGYAASDVVSVVTRPTDKQGSATFTGLDRSGATAYFAMTLLPRGKQIDRLTSSPVILDDAGGRRVVLSGAKRTEPTPVDDHV